MRLTDYTHLLWEPLIPKEATIIDATCGAGHDTLFLAKRARKLIAYDIQEDALDQTRLQLKSLPSSAHVELRLACHSAINEPAHFIVYNLGYLPGADKNISTKIDTTHLSIQKALKWIEPGCWISLMCYSGHPAGEIETESLLKFCSELNQKEFSVHLHRLLNGCLAPQTLLIQKSKNWTDEVKRSTDNTALSSCKPPIESALN